MKRHIITIAIALATFVCGYALGKHNTIHSAELYAITSDGYYIEFGNYIHCYAPLQSIEYTEGGSMS